MVEKWQCSTSVSESFIPSNLLKAGKEDLELALGHFSGKDDWKKSGLWKKIIENLTPSRACKRGHNIVYFGGA